MESAETDESGSLNFQAPTKEETALAMRESKMCFHHRVWCKSSQTPQMNPEERWYSRHEIGSFRKLAIQTQSLVPFPTAYLVGENDTEEDSFVGLVSGKESKQRAKRIKESRSCVLGEQVRQEAEFYNNQGDRTQSFKMDHESIANVYSIYSKKARKVAHLKGLQVSRHVENLWEEESADTDASHRPCSQSKSTSSVGSSGSLSPPFTKAAS